MTKRFSKDTYIILYDENAYAGGFGAATVAFDTTAMPAGDPTGAYSPDVYWNEAFEFPFVLKEYKKVTPVGMDGGKSYFVLVGVKPTAGKLITHWQTDPITWFTDFVVGAAPTSKCMHFHDGVQRAEAYGVYGKKLIVNVDTPNDFVKVSQTLEGYSSIAATNAVNKQSYSANAFLKTNDVILEIDSTAQTFRSLTFEIENEYTEKDVEEYHQSIELKNRIYKLRFTTADPINAVDLESYSGSSKTKYAVDVTFGSVITHQGVIAYTNAYISRESPARVTEAASKEILYDYVVELSEEGAVAWTPNT